MCTVYLFRVLKILFTTVKFRKLRTYVLSCNIIKKNRLENYNFMGKLQMTTVIPNKTYRKQNETTVISSKQEDLEPQEAA